MKAIRALAAVAACAAALAQAQVVYEVKPGETLIIMEPRVANGAPIHRGGLTLEDQLLADDVAYAIHSDRRLTRPGMTATVVARNGQVTISGTADNLEQAQRAERAAQRAAGTAHVAGTISVSGG